MKIIEIVEYFQFDFSTMQYCLAYTFIYQENAYWSLKNSSFFL